MYPSKYPNFGHKKKVNKKTERPQYMKGTTGKRILMLASPPTDVGLEQNGVARRLVDLNVVFVHQPFHLECVACASSVGRRQ